ncbi:MAG: hypothetical protein PHQ64_02295 [Bacilli bacterium]|nr:hypothetical protein [Bacilli bacterium]
MDDKVIRNLAIIGVTVLGLTMVLKKVALNNRVKQEKTKRFSPEDDFDEYEDMLDEDILAEEEEIEVRKYITLR